MSVREVAQRMGQLWEELVRNPDGPATVQGELVRLATRLRRECERNGNRNFDAADRTAVDFLRTHLASGAGDRDLEAALTLMAAADVSAMDGEPSGFDRLDAAILAYCERHRELVDAATGSQLDRSITCLDLDVETNLSPFWWPLPVGWDPRVAELARRGDREELEALLQSGAHPDSPRTRDSRNTPLWGLARDGRVETIEILLRHGADPNRSNLDGVSPLMNCLETARLKSKKRLPVLWLMLDHGADLNRVNQHGSIVLSYYANEFLLDKLMRRRVPIDVCTGRLEGQRIWYKMSLIMPKLAEKYVRLYGPPPCADAGKA